MTEPLVHEMFADIAKQQPAHPAIAFGRRMLTYGELATRSNALAQALLRHRLAIGDVVAVLTDDAIDRITCLMATLQAGCAYFPLDGAHPAARITKQIHRASPRLLIASDILRRRLSADGVPLQATPTIPLEDRRVFSHTESDSPKPQIGDDDLCYLFFTSGSTGIPKAVAGRQCGLSHFIRWEIENFHIDSSARVSQLSRPTFDVSLRDILLPLCSGGTVCVPSDRAVVADPDRLLSWLQAEAITVSHMVPTVMRSLLHTAASASSLESLRHLILAGEMLYPSDIAQWRATFGNKTALHNLYGPTETTLAKLYYQIQPSDVGRRGTIPVGKPLPNTELLVVGERGQLAGEGMIGEVYIGTRYRSLGYYREPELTAERFVLSPLDGAGTNTWYRTGDLGRILESGDLQLVGRQDGQVKISGVRIELAEVENLLQLERELVDSAVLDWPIPGGGRVLCAYYVSDHPIDESALRHRLGQELPPEAVPVSFRRLAELPRTLTDKVDRRMLPPPDQPGESAAKFIPPRTQTEAAVAEIAAKVLNRSEVNVEADFFVMGGNSLQAMILLARVSKHFGVTVPLAGLLETRTVAGLSRVIERVLQDRTATAAPIPRLAR